MIETGSATTQLVVIRGESGVGKSSLAAQVRLARPPGTLAVIGQDELRRGVLGGGAESHVPSVDLLDTTVRWALDHGYDVLLEGILGASRHAGLLTGLRDAHRGATRCYLYDVPFAETVRRHACREQTVDFGEAEMRSWWSGFQPIDGLSERVLPAELTLAEATAQVLADWQ